MASEYVPIDITNAPDLARVAEAVRQSGKPHALKRGAETVAVVRPAPKKERGRACIIWRGVLLTTYEDTYDRADWQGFLTTVGYHQTGQVAFAKPIDRTAFP